MKKFLISALVTLAVMGLSAQSKTHTVKKGESWYSISKIYGVKINDIVKANPGLTEKSMLHVGQTIKMPSAKAAVTTTAKTPAAKAVPNNNAVTITTVTPAKTDRVHVVQKGESLYGISKKYGVKLDALKQWNSITDNSVHPGQRLIVGKVNGQAIYTPKPVPSTPETPYKEEDERKATPEVVKQPEPVIEKPVEVKTNPAATPTANPKVSLRTTSTNPAEYQGVFNQYASKGFKIKRLRGAANYLEEKTEGNQYLAFYNDAEPGSIIRVTNMMNQRTIYVKVISQVPPQDAQRDLILKLSNKAAVDLGALDGKFLVEVTSYSAN